MPVWLRKFIYKKLEVQKKREKQQVDDATGDNGRTSLKPGIESPYVQKKKS